MLQNRAVAITIKGDEVLLMFRRKNGKEYFTFPGGGVEDGESVEQATIREIKEETTLDIKIEKLLYHHIYDNKQEQFFYLCSYLSGDPRLSSDSIEAQRLSDDNFYQPQWHKITDLPQMLVYPLEIRDWLVEDIKNGFTNTPKEAKIKISDIRRNL
ncbi:MAG: NUDIX domain-containing protein [Patescibacteria group bacterium]|jgi:ADP-ribose pyrophosphatase YjhB (NUDIX family)